MNRVQRGLAIVAILSSGASRAQEFREDFNSMTIQNGVSFSGLISCSANPNGPDPENVSMYVPGSDTWNFFASSSYPLTWQGTGATQAWAVGNGVLYTHAQRGTSDDGHAFISRRTFDRGRYLTATVKMAPDHCQDTQQGCFMGVTLIASETDYREIAFDSTGEVDALGRQLYQVGRWAPCDYRLFRDAKGNVIKVPGGVLYDLRLDYLGPEGGGWRYFVNGVQMQMPDAGGVPRFGEPGNFLKASLQADPHIGFYWAAKQLGKYFEGRMDDLVVHELVKVQPVAASAQSSYAGTPPSSAIDGNVGTQWNAGAGPSRWIELDLGGTTVVKKLRLLTSQSPAGQTTHRIYVGNTPAPASLVSTLNDVTSDNVWLEVDLLGRGISGRYIRIETVTSPGWVAWRELEVYR
ncbi:discoidin domain-containing protein [Cystobacter fuscus]|uniref:discoidin domain-containing protein n=1 Tax=Cystobacter fuscus TaxID=43 RepID=UPI002B293CD3|nr:discoidin domain-containing protein [Cystobacter fuscus]